MMYTLRYENFTSQFTQNPSEIITVTTDYLETLFEQKVLTC